MKTIMSQKCALLTPFLALLCFSFCFAHKTIPESAGVHSHAARLRFVNPDEPATNEPEPPGLRVVNPDEPATNEPEPPGLRVVNPDEAATNEPEPPGLRFVNADESATNEPEPPGRYSPNAAQILDPSPPDSNLENAAGLEQQQRSY